MLVLLVGLDDPLNDDMADHVGPAEPADGDVLHPIEHPHGLPETAHLVGGQVDLGDVSGNDDFGPKAHPGEEHFHLLPGGVLSLVQDDEGVVQGAAPHIGQRGHLDVPPLQVLVIGLRPQHVEEGVVEGTQIGVHLAL